MAVTSDAPERFVALSRGVAGETDGSLPRQNAWRAHLTASGVAIRSEMAWPRGGRSLYFDDPDGHVLELATPGLWATY